MRYLKAIFRLFQEAITRWSQDNAHLMAAALSYYMIFALAPLLIISINIAGAVFGQAAVEGQLYTLLNNLVGPEAAAFIESLVQNASEAAAGRLVAIVGVGILLYGASNVFYQMKMTLNVIWRIAPEPKNGLINYLKTRSIALFLVLTLGLLFLIAFALTIALTTLNSYLLAFFPNVERLAVFYQVAIIFPLMVVLVALLFKMLPDAHVAWRDVWLGSAVTAVLLMVGIQILSTVIGLFFTGSVYGAAGSLVVILYFVYYSAQILFFGAEFTVVYANKYGSQVRPSSHSVMLVRPSRVQEEPVYPMPVYIAPRSTDMSQTPTRKLEKRLAVGLVSTAVVLLAAFLYGRKS